MWSKRVFSLISFSLIFSVVVFSQDAFSGKYVLVDQAEYDAEQRWYEISRNRYQEIVINTEATQNCIGYYDEDNEEIYYIIDRPAQYNTLMKLRIRNDQITVYQLYDYKWKKLPFLYRKTK